MMSDEDRSEEIWKWRIYDFQVIIVIHRDQ